MLTPCSIHPSKPVIQDYQTMFDIPVEQKKNDFLKSMQELVADKINLFVMHVAEATPEMNALVDMNNTDQHSETKPLVAMHRNAELQTLLSEEFQQLIREEKIKLVTYRDLVRQTIR